MSPAQRPLQALSLAGIAHAQRELANSSSQALREGLTSPDPNYRLAACRLAGLKGLYRDEIAKRQTDPVPGVAAAARWGLQQKQADR